MIRRDRTIWRCLGLAIGTVGLLLSGELPLWAEEELETVTLKVDPVQEGSRNPVPIPSHHPRVTKASVFFPIKTARTRIHGGHEDKPGGEP